MIKKISALIILTFVVIPCVNLCCAQEAVETISYNVSPVGTCEYQDFGGIEYRGNKANLSIFKTNVVGFSDKEVIFSDIQTHLPIVVERDISMWLHHENITEEYFPNKNSVKLTKLEGGKKTEEFYLKGKAPIQSSILVPFSLRNVTGLKIGSSFDIVLPQEFKVKLVSIEDVTVPAGKFRTYHFTSTPPKFEIWISADILRLPVKIKGLGALPYVLEMKKRTSKQR